MFRKQTRVAHQLKVSTALVYRLVANGELAHVRVAGALRFTPPALQAYVRFSSR